MRALALSILFTCVACGSETAPMDAGGMPDAGAADAGPRDSGAPQATRETLGVDTGRPAEIVIPSRYADGTEMPLVILLHGYMVTAALQDVYFQLSRRAQRDGFLLLLPDGTLDADGAHFWDAAGTCCGATEPLVDDVGYLSALIAEARARFTVGKVYLAGHSNGAFMAYRYVCDVPGEVSAMVSLAGSIFGGVATCPASTAPVSVLQIHGDADDIIPYEGGTISMVFPGATYPGAVELVSFFADRNGCDTGAATMGEPLDLDVDPGTETDVLRYAEGCAAGTEVALFTMHDTGHLPGINAAFSDAVVAFLLAH